MGGIISKVQSTGAQIHCKALSMSNKKCLCKLPMECNTVFFYIVSHSFQCTKELNLMCQENPQKISLTMGYLHMASLRQSNQSLLHYCFQRTFHAKMIEFRQMTNSHSDSEIILISDSIYEIFVAATPHHASCSISKTAVGKRKKYLHN